MKATEAKLLDFLKKSPQFVIPIYQRTYSWTEKECRQLWDDIVRCGSSDKIAVHFVGSIVYIESGLSQVTHQAPLARHRRPAAPDDGVAVAGGPRQSGGRERTLRRFLAAEDQELLPAESRKSPASVTSSCCCRRPTRPRSRPSWVTARSLSSRPFA